MLGSYLKVQLGKDLLPSSINGCWPDSTLHRHLDWQPQSHADWWPEAALSSHHMGLSNTAACFIKMDKGGSWQSLLAGQKSLSYETYIEVTSQHLCSSLLVRGELHAGGRDYTRVWISGSRDYSGRPGRCLPLCDSLWFSGMNNNQVITQGRVIGVLSILACPRGDKFGQSLPTLKCHFVVCQKCCFGRKPALSYHHNRTYKRSSLKNYLWRPWLCNTAFKGINLRRHRLIFVSLSEIPV